MRKIFTLFICIGITSLLHAQTVLLTNTTYTENFDGLANTGTSSTVPNGWLFLETLTNANTIYTATDGALNSGDTYSFGTTAASDRAFGMLQSGSLISTIGCGFTNNTGSNIVSFTIKFNGEQWRLGATGRADKITFQYSTDATNLATGTWTDVASLDYSSSLTTGSAGALNGNSALNRTENITATITVTIAQGATFYIRWNDFNVTGSDDGLGIDDFSLTPNIASSVNNIIRNPNYVRIAGNPGSDLNIQFNQAVSSDVQIQFFSANGEMVLQKRLGRIMEGQVEKVSLGHLPKGLYLLSIKSKEGTFTTKVVN